MYKNIVAGVAKDYAGKEFPLTGLGNTIATDRARVSQVPLQPGETRYMHPDGENYGFIVIPETLPPGKYAITVTLNNDVSDGELGPVGKEKSVKFWTGKISAPVVTIDVPKKPAASQSADK